MEGNHLITTDAWFYAPDGKQYKAVWGNVQITDDSVLGVKTNARSSNWFAKVGNDENYVIVAGCQIHYAIKCDKPIMNDVEDYVIHDGDAKVFNRPTAIYIAE
jgi:hypothetical protein